MKEADRKLPVDERRMWSQCEYILELCTELIVGCTGLAAVIQAKVSSVYQTVLMEESRASGFQIKVVTRQMNVL
ncbi:hypothetical protein NCCP28_24050 [Niallia sp. NCCP-28]|nr:hypothetical protein NCCP28_24050 [Niallia sp. NCCP-28]